MGGSTRAAGMATDSGWVVAKSAKEATQLGLAGEAYTSLPGWIIPMGHTMSQKAERPSLDKARRAALDCLCEEAGFILPCLQRAVNARCFGAVSGAVGAQASPSSRGNVGRRSARRASARTCKCSLRRRPPDSLERFRAPSPSGIGCIRTTRWAWPRHVQQRASQSLRARNVPWARQVAASSAPHSQQYRSPRTRGWDGTQGAGYERNVTQ